MDENADEEQQWDRRHFLKTSALVGAGLAFGGARGFAHGAPAAVAALYGDGGLTAIALADDGARLARHADGMEPAFKEVLRRSVNEALPGNVALLGDMVRMSGEQAVGLLRSAREGGLEREEGEDEDRPSRAAQKLALALGWMMHQGTRAQLGPLHADETTPGGDRYVSQLYPSEQVLYHDAAVLRHRSAGKTAAGNGEQVEAVARLFQELGPRMLLRFHTFIPDFDDGAGWINRLSTWRDEQEALLRRLAEAYQAPDPDKLQRYVTEPNFYDEGDALLQVARALRAGEDPPMNVAEAAAETARNESHYAQALRQAYGHVEAASAYFGGGLSEEELIGRFP